MSRTPLANSARTLAPLIGSRLSCKTDLARAASHVSCEVCSVPAILLDNFTICGIEFPCRGILNVPFEFLWDASLGMCLSRDFPYMLSVQRACSLCGCGKVWPFAWSPPWSEWNSVRGCHHTALWSSACACPILVESCTITIDTRAQSPFLCAYLASGGRW